MNEPTLKYKETESMTFVTQPEVNVIIHITDNLTWQSHRAKPFNRFQRKMMSICFGWKVEDV